MSTAALQHELFPEIVHDSNARPKKRNAKAELDAMAAQMEVNGMLLPPALAAVILDVSRTRVHQLMQECRLRTFTFFDKPFVCEDDVIDYANSEREAGRPVTGTDRTKGEFFKDCAAIAHPGRKTAAERRKK